MRWLTLSLEATISVSGTSGKPIYKCENIGWNRNRFFLTLWWKAIFKTWCSTTQKKTKIVTSLHFFKILFIENKAKNNCKTVISGKEQNLNKKWLNLEFPFFFNNLVTFWPNSILFKVLKFNNSILSNRVGTLCNVWFLS